MTTPQPFRITEPLQTGDYLFTYGRRTIHKLIRWFSRGRGDPASKASHSARGYDTTYVLNPDRPAVHLVRWHEYQRRMLQNGTEWCLLRRGGLTDDDHKRMRMVMDEMVGWRYSELELPLHALDGMLAKLSLRKNKDPLDYVVFRRMQDLWKRGVICSSTAARIDIKSGFAPERHRFITPASQYRWCIADVSVHIVSHSAGWQF